MLVAVTSKTSDEMIGSSSASPSHPVHHYALLQQSVVNLLRTLSICCAIHGDKVERDALSTLSSLLRSVVDSATCFPMQQLSMSFIHIESWLHLVLTYVSCSVVIESDHT